jgi:hypothetical protein
MLITAAVYWYCCALHLQVAVILGAFLGEWKRARSQESKVCVLHITYVVYILSLGYTLACMANLCRVHITSTS